MMFHEDEFYAMRDERDALQEKVRQLEEAATGERQAYDDLLVRTKLQEARLDDLRAFGIQVQRSDYSSIGAEILRLVDGVRS